MRVGLREKKDAQKNRRAFQRAIKSTYDGKDRFGRINSILNPKLVVGFTGEGRRRFEDIDWTR